MHKLRWLVAFLVLAFACGCTPAQHPAAIGAGEEHAEIADNPPNSDGKPFLDDLARAARDSDRIVLVEHSYIYDNAGSGSKSDFLPERKYEEVVLTGSERDRFTSMLREMDPYLSFYASMCVFEPHHRFEFYSGAKRTNTLEVCFQCAQLEWDGSKQGEPKAFYRDLSKFVKSVGLQPDRDWHALAKQASKP